MELLGGSPSSGMSLQRHEEPYLPVVSPLLTAQQAHIRRLLAEHHDDKP